MRSVILRSLLVIGAGGLVLVGVLYVASTIDARDGERDGNISCQSGVDTAYVDAIDDLVHDCENVIVG